MVAVKLPNLRHREVGWSVEPAQNRSLSIDVLRDQFGRLGNTPYQLGELSVEITGSPFVPVSMLNQLRRQAVEQLQTLQTRPRAVKVVDAPARRRDPRPISELAPALHLLVRTPAQLDAAIGLRPASITLDYLDLYGLRPSIERVKSAGIAARVASPRVLKPGERRIVDFLKNLDCAILVRSAGMIQALRGAEQIGDFSLNAANSLSAESYLSLGLTRLTPTHDLNAAQITALARLIGSDKLEAIAYQHLPVFHTEHCVFCRFLSTGTSYRDCGRPCEKHVVQLKDESGRAHPVMADVGCRNTVFGAEAQEASAHLDSWLHCRNSSFPSRIRPRIAGSGDSGHARLQIRSHRNHHRAAACRNPEKNRPAEHHRRQPVRPQKLP